MSMRIPVAIIYNYILLFQDVVVSDQYRGRQLGKFLVTVSVLLAAKLGCYKVTLNCKDEMTKFYNGIGFKCEEGDANFMVIRL